MARRSSVVSGVSLLSQVGKYSRRGSWASDGQHKDVIFREEEKNHPPMGAEQYPVDYQDEDSLVEYDAHEGEDEWNQANEGNSTSMG